MVLNHLMEMWWTARESRTFLPVASSSTLCHVSLGLHGTYVFSLQIYFLVER